MRKEKTCSSEKRNISWRHTVPAFSASEPCSCSQVELPWFLFDIQSCSGFTERGWVSQVMTAKWVMHTLPLSNADLDQIQAAQSDPIWAAPGEHSWLSGYGSAGLYQSWLIHCISCHLSMSALRASALHACDSFMVCRGCTIHYFIPSAPIWFLPHLQVAVAPCLHHFVVQWSFFPPTLLGQSDVYQVIRL